MPPKAPPPAEDEGLDDFLALDKSEDVVPAKAEAHPILSSDEVAAAKAKARDRIEKERRLAAMRQIEEEETRRLRHEEGLVSGITDEDRLVWVTVDLPEWALNVTVNSHPYWHGHSYQVPVHVLRSIQEQMQASWRAHDLSEGKSIAQQFQGRRNTVLGPAGATNAPRHFDA